MDIDAMYNLAQQHLEKKELDAAAKLGDQLIRARYSGGYEILSRSFLLRGQSQQAITVLERGLKDTPQVWRLWVELASIRGREGQFDQAISDYERARQCPEADLDAIDFNEARLAHDRDRPRRAALLLEGILDRSTDKDSRLVALTELLRILAIRGRMGEVMAILGQEKLPYSEVADILNILSDAVMATGNIFEATRLSDTAKKAKAAALEEAAKDSSDSKP